MNTGVRAEVIADVCEQNESQEHAMTREDLTHEIEGTELAIAAAHNGENPDRSTPGTEPVAEPDVPEDSDAGDRKQEPACPADSVGAAMARELEAAHWKTKAVHAQDLVESLERALASMRSRLEETTAELSRSEQRRAIDQALLESRTIDMDTSRVLIERAMAEPGDERRSRDVESVVRDLKRRKPHLFETSRAKVHASGVLEDQEFVSEASLERAAEEARTGDRGALLRYLRLRRATTEENGTLSA